MILRHAQKAYVRALFGLCEKQDCIKPVYMDMKEIKKITIHSRELTKFLSDYSISKKKRDKCLRLIFEKNVHPLTWRFLTLLENKRRMKWLATIADLFEELYREKQKIKKIYVESAFPLEKEHKEKIIQKVARKIGMQIECEDIIKPELIGGFAIRIDDIIYDWTIDGFLKRLKKNFTEA